MVCIILTQVVSNSLEEERNFYNHHKNGKLHCFMAATSAVHHDLGYEREHSFMSRICYKLGAYAMLNKQVDYVQGPTMMTANIICMKRKIKGEGFGQLSRNHN